VRKVPPTHLRKLLERALVSAAQAFAIRSVRTWRCFENPWHIKATGHLRAE
jgi:hypothetical protein